MVLIQKSLIIFKDRMILFLVFFCNCSEKSIEVGIDILIPAIFFVIAFILKLYTRMSNVKINTFVQVLFFIRGIETIQNNVFFCLPRLS